MKILLFFFGGGGGGVLAASDISAFLLVLCFILKFVFGLCLWLPD